MNVRNTSILFKDKNTNENLDEELLLSAGHFI